MGVEPISMVLGDEREERGVNIVGGMSEIARLEGVWGSAPGGEQKKSIHTWTDATAPCLCKSCERDSKQANKFLGLLIG